MAGRPGRRERRGRRGPGWTVHPPSKPVPGCCRRPWLRSGDPTTPKGGRLRLLPSGPDLVHGSSSPRDRTIDAAHRALTPGPVPLGRGFSPARADCGYRAPLAPRLARSRREGSCSAPRRARVPTDAFWTICARSPVPGIFVDRVCRGDWSRIRGAAAGGRVRGGRRARHRRRCGPAQDRRDPRR